ncbi:MAG: uncharacterized protein A8A55_3298 [Amphiamblys sp. WSBS2006]|nr:MAG: uncharacterized protein A8A55_3298 [Amphiamblys sp. WSBS2006]
MLSDFWIQLLPKLKLHEEIQNLCLFTESSDDITTMLGKENRSIYIDMVKNLELHGHAIEILPKLKFHKESDGVASLACRQSWPNQQIGKTKDSSILPGRANNFYVYYFTIDALPKLKFQEGPVMKDFGVIANAPTSCGDSRKKQQKHSNSKGDGFDSKRHPAET